VMIEKLREIARGENIAIDDAALAAIAYRAEGGLRDALTMLEQLAAFSGGAEAGVETLELAFGSSGREFAHSLVEAVIARDATRALAIVEAASDAGTDLAVLTRSLIAAFRNLLVGRIDPALLARDLAPDDAERVAVQAAAVSQAMLVRALRGFSDALALARSGGNARLELETALLRFIFTPEDPTLDALAARVATLEERNPGVEGRAPGVIAGEGRAQSVILSGATVRSAVEGRASKPTLSEPFDSAQDKLRESKGKAPAAPAALSVQKVRAAWQSIRGKVEGERQSLRAPLSRAVIDSLEGDALVLKLPDKWSADALKDHAKILETAIADVLGMTLHVRLRVEANGTRSKPVAADDADALFDYANERIR